MLKYGIIFLSIFLSLGDKLHARELQTKISQLDTVGIPPSEKGFFPGPRNDNERRAAAMFMSKTGNTIAYYGFIASITVYGQPDLQPGQQTTSFFTVIHPGDGNSINQIYVGWRVNPQVYGDSHPHFSTFWSRDQANTGCWDLGCGGFIVDNSTTLKPGDALDQYYDITIKLYKDNSGDWQLLYGTDENSLKPMGYFPAVMFTYLQFKATLIEFGGHVDFKPDQKSPPMGSGKLPSEGEPAAAAFKGVKYIDQNGNYYAIGGSLDSRLDDSDCYGLGSFNNDQFLYGGPGGCSRGY